MNPSDLTWGDWVWLATVGPLAAAIPEPSQQQVEGVIGDAVQHPIDTITNAAFGFSTGMIAVFAIGAYLLLKK